MDLEIVTVGTELLLGLTVDTNAAELARALAPVGARLVRKSTVPDDERAIGLAVDEALRRTGFVLVTGGLGPTSDDVTKEAVARLFGVPLDLDEAYLAALERRFAELGRAPLPPANRRQAEVPRGAEVLRNPRGTAPGLWLEGKRGVAVLLPGVPHEMRGMVRDEVLPRIERRTRALGERAAVIVSRTLRTTGIAESALAERLESIEPSLAPVTLAYLPGVEGVDLRLTVWNAAPNDAALLLEQAASVITPLLASSYYGDEGADLAAIVLELLRRRHATLAVAESCTGGLVGARVTAIPGSSDVFLGGVLSYADDVKQRELGVGPELLAGHGAVSEPVVRAMALGAQQRFGATATLAVTGIAGPSGGTAQKPVGTVWLAARLANEDRVVCRRFAGERRDVRERAAQAGLDLLRHMLQSQ